MSKYDLYYYDKNNVYIHNKLHNKIFKKEGNLFKLTDLSILDLAQKELYHKKLDPINFPEIDLVIKDTSIEFSLIKTDKLLNFLENFSYPTKETTK